MAESGSMTATLLKSRLPKLRPTGSPGLRQRELPIWTTDPPSPVRPAQAADRPVPPVAVAVASWASTPPLRSCWPCITESGGEASPVFFSPVPSLVAVTLPVPCALPAIDTVTALAPAWEIGAAAMAGATAIAPNVTAPITDAKRRYERIEKFPPQE